MNKGSPRLTLLALLLGLLLAACSGREAPPLQGTRLGGPFTLVDQDGRSVRDSDFAGKYRIVYFGYTFCPDACPTDLQIIGQGLSRFEKSDPARGAKVQPIFISVDPARDTPAVLKRYVAAFHPRMIGLTGPENEIAKVAKSYGAFYARQPGGNGGAYLVDHSRQALLFGPKGEPLVLVPADQGAQAVAETLDKWVE